MPLELLLLNPYSLISSHFPPLLSLLLFSRLPLLPVNWAKVAPKEGEEQGRKEKGKQQKKQLETELKRDDLELEEPRFKHCSPLLEAEVEVEVEVGSLHLSYHGESPSTPSSRPAVAESGGRSTHGQRTDARRRSRSC